MSFSCLTQLNELIAKRHIKRKIQSDGAIYENFKFDQCDTRFEILNKNVIKNPSSCVEEKLFEENSNILLPIDTAQFTLFNDSPPMDLDEDQSYSESKSEKSDEDQFREWFTKLYVQMEMKINLNCISNEDVFIEMIEDNIALKGESECLIIDIKSCWSLIHLVCKSPAVHVLTISSKPLTKAILYSCEKNLNLNSVDMARIISFMCDHPFYDMQLAQALLTPGESYESFNDLVANRICKATYSGDKLELNMLIKTKNVIIKLKDLNYIFVYENIICPSNIILAFLEYRGIKINIDLWTNVKSQLQETLKSLEMQAGEVESSAVTLNSPLQLREVIYSKLKLHKNISEKEMKEIGIDHLINIRSTNELVLSKLSKFHLLPNIIVQYRRISKLKSIYIDSFSIMMSPENYLIKGEWDQTSSVTGRIFCSKPNLQALPRDYEDDNKINIKSIFVASDNQTFISADFCQIELRIFSHMAHDQKLIKMFQETDKDQKDIFNKLSKDLDICLEEDFNKRQITKKVIYGCLYGIGMRSLSETLSICLNKASDLLKKVNIAFPSIKEFSNKSMDALKSKGFVETITGRKRYFKIDNGWSNSRKVEVIRQMVNYIIQGSAADICKIAMVECQKKFGYKCINAQLVLTRHDELVWLVHDDSLAEMLEVVRKEMNIFEIPMNFTNFQKKVILDTTMKIKLKRGSSLGNMECI